MALLPSFSLVCAHVKRAKALVFDKKWILELYLVGLLPVTLQEAGCFK